MKSAHTIGKLATEVGIPTSTVRYYERAGLLRPNGRTAGNYRVYTREAIDRVRFIRAAQTTGFTLADIRELLDLRDGARIPRGDVRDLVRKRLEIVDSRMREFRHVRHVLLAFLEACAGSQETEKPGNPIENLSLAEAPAPKV